MSCFSLKKNISFKKFYDNLKKSNIFLDNLDLKIERVNGYKNTKNIDQYFISKNILKFINTHEGSLYKVNSQIENRKFNINIIDYKDSNKDSNKNIINKNIRQFFKMIFFVINFLSLYASSKCSKTIDITIFLTPFKKLYNNKQILGVNEVNTGYSSCGCNNIANIVIYREEEWFKVLIHELFHNLNLDFCDYDVKESQRKLRVNLKIQAKFNIYESYCEASARFINVLIYSFFNNFNMVNYRQFRENFKINFEKEVENSLLKAGLIISKIKNIKLYKEDSNVFDYYVITAALLYNFNNFIKFINYDFDFKKTQDNINNFTNLIISSFNYDFFEAIECIGFTKSNSLKMTITNIF